VYSHASHDGDPIDPPAFDAAARERPRAPVSARVEATTGSRADRRHDPGTRIRVAVVGATGYVGGELVRLLARHPGVEIVGLVGRERDDVPLATVHAHLDAIELAIDRVTPEADAYFLALPHSVAAARVPELVARRALAIDLGPDFRLRDPADYPRWYHFEHPTPDLLGTAVYGLPELHRAELAALGEAPTAIVGAPGCFPTATLLALAPLARAGLIGDLVVDAKTGVSGAGREPRPDLTFAEVNESVRAYGVDGHRHAAEIEQELLAVTASAGLARSANPGAAPVDFLPHLVPMTRGIFAACHVRPTRSVTQGELDTLYAEAYAGEPFVRVVQEPPATGHVLGSNEARVFVRADERTGRILAIGVVDNLVKGAAGQAIQAFNVVFGLAETAGLEQLPLAP
jgi:N-acetyl-gamma-glutamyl-phosphate reductase